MTELEQLKRENEILKGAVAEYLEIISNYRRIAVRLLSNKISGRE